MNPPAPASTPIPDVEAFLLSLEASFGFPIGIDVDVRPGSPGLLVLGAVVPDVLGRLRDFAAHVEASREPDFVIGHPDVYLRRWKLEKHAGVEPRLHVFHRSDDARAHHDHPWDSLSICLREGAYDLSSEGRLLKLEPGMVVYRTAEYGHMVQVDDGHLPTTLFMTGPKIREWGFHCTSGWRHWREFHRPVDGDDEGMGRGCD